MMTPQEAQAKKKETESKFPPGSIVKFRINSPQMVVRGYQASYVKCQWFAGKKLEEGLFAPESLVLVEGDAASPKPE